jgi:hypothetical protein
MGVFRKKITVTDGEGKPAPAILAVCHCRSEQFSCYLVFAGGEIAHLHLQCVRCGMSYCDGVCGDQPDVGGAE